MKRLILGILCLLTSLTALAQGQVSTRSYRLADFPDKVTKVVLSGNAFLNSAIKQEVVMRWTASPFEFCTLAEFETLKESEEYYFLFPAATRFKGEEQAGIVSLSLVKGGPEAARGMSAMYEVISLPLASADGSSGRELTYAGPIIKAIQDFTLEAMVSEKAAYTRDAWFKANYDAAKQLYLAREDLSQSVSKPVGSIRLCSADEADKYFLSHSSGILVSYTVAPENPSAGSYSYQLVFDAESETLCYLSRHKITPKSPAGFTLQDIKWLSRKK